MREWLRDLRKAKGLTVKQLGQAVGVSEPYMFSIEQGERQKRMDIALLMRIARATDESMVSLIVKEAEYEGLSD